jgi:hypothetical protein
MATSHPHHDTYAWKHSLAFCHIMNGDYLAIDTSPSASMRGKILYLSHEGVVGPDNVQGLDAVIADDFFDYLEKISFLGCPGPELWHMEPFLSKSQNGGLLTTSRVASEWRARIGLQDLP